MQNQTTNSPGTLFGRSAAEIDQTIRRDEHVLCPLCGTAPKPFAIDYQGFQLCACETCGTQFMSPRPVLEDLLQSVYTENYHQAEIEDITEPDAYEKEQFNRQLDKFEQIAGTRGKLLDVGCGQGKFLSMAQQRGWEIFGSDVRLSSGARRLGCKLWEKPLPEIDFGGETFDVIRFNHVLEHTQNPLTELIKCYELLKTDGLLYVSVPNLAGVSSGIKKLQSRLHLKSHRWRHYAASHHLFFFTPPTLRIFLERAGFEVLKIETPVLKRSGQNALLEKIYKNTLERWNASSILDAYCKKQREAVVQGAV